MRYKLRMQSGWFLSSYLFFLLFALVIPALILFSPVSVAHAITPTLSLCSTGDGDSVQLSVTGDPNANVLLYYLKSGFGQQMVPLGNTGTGGTLNFTISSSQYGVPSNSMVHVTIGGINGAQSPDVVWPAVSSLISSNNMITLSQTGLVLQVGQSSSITAGNIGSSSIYLSGNSNPAIANFNISGNQITVLANSYGSTVGTICLTGNSSNCSSIYITVQTSSVQPLTFSQSSVSISPGQTIAIQITGGSGSYSVLNNGTQNQAIIQTVITGSTLTLTTSSTAGSSSLTVCSTNMSSCGIINVTVGNNTTSGIISFSQSNPTVTIGQNLNVSIFGPSGSLLYVNSNSSPNVVQANLSGTTLTLLGIVNGTSTINICSSASNCGSLIVTVTYATGSSGNLMLSQDNVYLSVGQTSNITISGGSMPYNILSNANNIFQPTLNVNILTLLGIGIGSSSMNVCSAGGNCATLSVTVNANGQNYASALPAGCSSTAGYSQTTGMSCSTISGNTTTTLPAGCSSATGFSLTTGVPCNYSYVPVTTPAPVVSAPPADCTPGIQFSPSTGLGCPITAVINTPAPAVVSTPAPAPTPNPTPVPTPAPATNILFKFSKSIKLGSTGTEVSELQKKLKTLGFYKGKIDGGFGAGTEKAVKTFQKAHKLAQVGSIGPATRALLNKN